MPDAAVDVLAQSTNPSVLSYPDFFEAGPTRKKPEALAPGFAQAPNAPRIQNFLSVFDSNAAFFYI